MVLVSGRQREERGEAVRQIDPRQERQPLDTVSEDGSACPDCK